MQRRRVLWGALARGVESVEVADGVAGVQGAEMADVAEVSYLAELVRVPVLSCVAGASRVPVVSRVPVFSRDAVAFVACAAAVAVVLSGCAVQQQSTLTDSETRERFLTVLADAQTVVGGEWKILDDPTPRECVIPLWVIGERYPALRVGDPPVSVAVAADRTERAWTDVGMRVTRTDIGDVVEVKGESGDGEIVVLRVSESASTLIGESECRPL